MIRSMRHIPGHEFNFWWDPEAAHITLRAHWKRIDLTTVDISVKTFFTKEMQAEISKSKSLAAQYLTKYQPDGFYMWDELAAAAWVDPSVITKEETLYLDVDTTRGTNYGDTPDLDEGEQAGVHAAAGSCVGGLGSEEVRGNVCGVDDGAGSEELTGCGNKLVR